MVDKEGREVLMGSNYDMYNIVTPVNGHQFARMLEQQGNDQDKVKFIEEGFTRGFSLKFQGNRKVKRTAPNLKLRIGNSTELWKKVMTEVQAGRFAGPFDKIPFEHYIQSPIGPVPKDKGTKTRLIFHLSYPRNDSAQLVNEGIPQEECTVKYPTFEDAVRLCAIYGKSCNFA